MLFKLISTRAFMSKSYLRSTYGLKLNSWKKLEIKGLISHLLSQNNYSKRIAYKFYMKDA